MDKVIKCEKRRMFIVTCSFVIYLEFFSDDSYDFTCLRGKIFYGNLSLNSFPAFHISQKLTLSPKISYNYAFIT